MSDDSDIIHVRSAKFCQAGYDGGRGPPRAGIGAYGAAQNVPPANGPVGGAVAYSGERFSLFMSGIPTELSDQRLQEVLDVRCGATCSRAALLKRSLCQTVGTVVKINRMRDAAGKPKGFGFVEYGDPEHVLRALDLLDGITLVGKDRESKPLAIKADAKVRARLDEHESSRMKTSVRVLFRARPRHV